MFPGFRPVQRQADAERSGCPVDGGEMGGTGLRAPLQTEPLLATPGQGGDIRGVEEVPGRLAGPWRTPPPRGPSIFTSTGPSVLALANCPDGAPPGPRSRQMR